MRKCLLAAALFVAATAPAAEAAAPRLTPAKALTAAEAATTVRVSVSLSRPAARATTVRYATRAGTATAADFVARRGTLRFKRGARKVTVAIRLKPDALDEPDETFTIRFSQPRRSRLGARKATTVTIRDDDGVPVPGGPGNPGGPGDPGGPGNPGGPTGPGGERVQIVAPDATVMEPHEPGAVAPIGAVVLLDRAAATRVTVDYELISSGPATTSDDIDLGKGTLAFAPGETGATIPGNLKGDAQDEVEESVRIAFSNPTGAVLPDTEAFLTIFDDPDDAPGF